MTAVTFYREDYSTLVNMNSIEIMKPLQNYTIKNKL